MYHPDPIGIRWNRKTFSHRSLQIIIIEETQSIPYEFPIRFVILNAVKNLRDKIDAETSSAGRSDKFRNVLYTSIIHITSSII
jgi:hypothetical protein